MTSIDVSETVDKRLLSLLSYIEQQRQVWTILDYGCGNGVLLHGLATLPPPMIRLMRYVGLDPDAERLAATRQVAASLGLALHVHLATPLEYFSDFTDQYFDLVFVINVLHELPVRQAPWMLSGLLCRLRDSGLLMVADMSKLPEGENNYVCWDESDFMGFRTRGIDFSFQATNTQRTRIPAFTAAMALKLPRSVDLYPDGFNPRSAASATIDGFQHKRRLLAAKMKELRGEGKERTRHFAIYLTQFRNLTIQLESSFGIKPHLPSSSDDAICPLCQCWLIYGEDSDIEGEDAFWYRWCPVCTFEEGTHYPFGYDYIDGYNQAYKVKGHDSRLRHSALLKRPKEAVEFYGLKHILELKTRIWNTS